jgi:hypothetical protein
MPSQAFIEKLNDQFYSGHFAMMVVSIAGDQEPHICLTGTRF